MLTATRKPRSTRNKIVAKAVVLDSQGQIIMLRRSAIDEHRPGTWDFPGGGIEPGEEIIAGVARELSEETGLSILVTDFRLVYAATELWETSNESITRFLFATHLPDQATVSLSFEHDDSKWVDNAVTLTEFPHPFYVTGLKYITDHHLIAA